MSNLNECKCITKYEAEIDNVKNANQDKYFYCCFTDTNIKRLADKCAKKLCERQTLLYSGDLCLRKQIWIESIKIDNTWVKVPATQYCIVSSKKVGSKKFEALIVKSKNYKISKESVAKRLVADLKKRKDLLIKQIYDVCLKVDKIKEDNGI